MTLHTGKLASLLGAVALALSLAACGGKNSNEGNNRDEGEHAEAEEAKKGVHGGRLMEQGGYCLLYTSRCV